ncbi:MAG: class I SAM-dependent methyltransferase family protein [Candidatus Thorarchaeota archaeon]|jgi:tRNA wybutosine-synthesizing protein 2
MRYRDFLRSRLSGIVSSEIVLPTGFHLVGHVALVHLDFETMKYASVIGEKTLEYDQRILSVAVRTGPTEGITRLPSYELVAGNGNTITTHIENGVKYRLDPLRLTFSGGNRRERMRLSRVVNEGERIVDMFSCVGQFALQIAMSVNVEVTAIEINQDAYRFLLENIKLNNLEEKVTALLGDCREIHPKRTANRIVMGYLHDTIEYLPFALNALVDDGGVVHMHMNVPDSGLDYVRMSIRKVCKNHGYSSTINVHHVKNYSPGIEHYVFDITTTPEA